MKNRSILRMFAAILAFSVFSVFPAFAKGGVIGYVWGKDTPTADQLDRLTHPDGI